MAAKLTRPTHRIVIQLHLVAESCTICNSRSRRPVRKLLDTASCMRLCSQFRDCKFLTPKFPFLYPLRKVVTVLVSLRHLHVPSGTHTSCSQIHTMHGSNHTLHKYSNLNIKWVSLLLDKINLSLCLTKHRAMKIYWGSGGIAPRIL
jgi:hypothetical protein